MTQSERWMIFAGVVVAGLLVYLLQPILAPFLTAALLAYLGSPLVKRLENAGVPRAGGVLVVFIGLLLAVTGLVLLLIPMIGSQIEYLQRTLPELLAWLEARIVPWLEARFGLDLSGVLELASVGELIAEHWRETGNVARDILGHVTRSGLAFAGFLVNLALIPVVTFYLLRDWPRVVAGVRGLLPRPLEARIVALAQECDSVLGAFLRGQLLVMAILAFIYAGGLWLVGLELALLVGVIAGLLSIVPYLGTIVGIAIALIAGLFQFGDWTPLIWILLLFGIGNLLEGMVLAPVLIGDRIGLHPVAVIFAILAGGQLFGFVGVLLALPAAAVIMVLLRHAHARYRGSRLFGGADEPTSSDPGG